MNKRARVVAAALAVGLHALSLTTATNAAPDRDNLEAAEERLMEIEREFEIVVERHNAARERLESIQARIGTIGLEIRSLQRRMAGTRDAAVRLATELYKSGPAQGLETVLSARTIADAQTRLDYLSSSQDATSRVFERLNSHRRALDAHLAELDAARADAVASRNEMSELRASVESKLAAQRDEIAEITAEIEAAGRRAEKRARRAAAAAASAAAASAPEVPRAPAGIPNPNARIAVEAALSQVGKPYRWGAAGPDSYDCSGLTMWAWARAGVALPHNSQMQYDTTARVDRSDWRPGDLLFFGSPIHHVGMYIGDGRMVAAPYTGSEVHVTSAERSDYAGAGRPY